MFSKSTTSIFKISVCILILAVTCVNLSCKIPRSDNHRNWTTLAANKDPRFSIEKVVPAYVIVNLDDPNQFISYGDSVRVITDQGAIKHTFKIDPEDILIDKSNNRLLEQATTFKKWKVEIDSVFVIDLQNFKKVRLPITEKIVSETYEGYKKRMGIDLKYSVDKADEFVKKDSLYTLKYIESQQEYVGFLQTLLPVMQLINKYGGRDSRIALYSNKKGELFKILYSDFITPHNFESYMRSLDRLWPEWNFRPYDYLTKFKKGNFLVADKSRVMGNELDVDLWHNRIGFDQNYVNYYAIKLKDSLLNFKVFDNNHIIYLEKDLQDFQQLNVPKNDSDTLAFVYDNYLYRAYLRNRK